MRHNKKRNSALLYEFLIRHISGCLINDDKQGAAKAMDISKRYFSQGTALRDELNLFNSILKTNVKSRDSAQRILNEVLRDAARMNSRRLDAEKSNLIKEVNYSFDDRFYRYKIPNYTVYASICTLLNEKRNKKKVLSSVNRIKLEDSVVEHLVNKEAPVNGGLKIDPNYNNVVYRFATQKFHKKYENKLNESQKRLLTKYAVYLISENKDAMDKAIQTEVANIKKRLVNIQDVSVMKDKELMSKLRECYTKLSEVNFDVITEEKILELLKYVKLADEVEV
jgi:hypothetical protein